MNNNIDTMDLFYLKNFEDTIYDYIINNINKDMTADELKEKLIDLISDGYSGEIDCYGLYEDLSSFLFEMMSSIVEDNLDKYIIISDEDKKKIKVDNYLKKISTNTELLKEHYNLLGLENNDNQKELDEMKYEDVEDAKNTAKKNMNDDSSIDLFLIVFKSAVEQIKQGLAEINYFDNIISLEKDNKEYFINEASSSIEKSKIELEYKKTEAILQVIKNSENEIVSGIIKKIIQKNKEDYIDEIFGYLYEEIENEIEKKLDEIQITSDDVKQHIDNNKHIKKISISIPDDEMFELFMSNVSDDSQIIKK